MTLISSHSCNRVGTGLVISCLATSVALAGPLDDFARNNGGTSLQIDIADAITGICPTLVGSFGGISGALAAPDSPDKDITLRCNELVGTAAVFNDPATQGARTLGYTDSNDLLAALQQVTGEEIVAQNTMTVRAANSQFSNIAARLGALRLAAAASGTSGPATAFNFDFNGMNVHSDVGSSLGAFFGGGAQIDEPVALKPAGFFVNGSYNTGDRDASALEDGFDFDMLGLTAGFDYRFNTGVLGVSVGYDDFSSEFNPSALVSGGDIEASGMSASVFGLKDFGNFFVDAIVTYGQLDYDIGRILQYASSNNDPTCQCGSQDRTLTSASDGDHTSVSVSAGWQWYQDEWLFQPTIGLSSRNYKIDGYTELDSDANGGMELRFGDQDVDSLQSVLGLQVSRAIPRGFGVLRPWFGVEWYHEFEDDQNVLQAKYAQEDVLAASNPALGFSGSLANCLSCFSISSDEPDTDFGVVGVGLSFVYPNFMQLLFYYEGLVGYENLTSNAFTVNLRGQF